ncbi:MAG: RhuM family protein [Candidatus Stygibacter australis]|nr:RhuM family protein [Candidatus Stygibacter australis]MDP8321275.1 RhuM family protein [Candidatus Stygibacter australis]
MISKHLKNIFNSKKLNKESVCAKIAHTATDNKVYTSEFYNLDAIIAVGYRVNSHEVTKFRKWATQILRSYIIKGFALDDELLKNGRNFGKYYKPKYFTS